MCGVHKESTVVMKDFVEFLGGVMDKLRYIFFYTVMLCLGGVHGLESGCGLAICRSYSI